MMKPFPLIADWGRIIVQNSMYVGKLLTLLLYFYPNNTMSFHAMYHTMHAGGR